MKTTVNRSIYFMLWLVLSLLSSGAIASDLAKEKRWADQVVDSILDGEVVWLNDGTSDFLTIYTEAEEGSDRAVIVMHGTGVHPDWQQVVQPLRVGLTEHGWNTLSIQMPILHNEAEYYEYAPLYDEVAPRIDAAIHYLKKSGMNHIVLVGHSQGAAMAAYYLSSKRDDVDGFVAIGIAASDADGRMDSTAAIEKIHVPMLDLYGDEDLELIRLFADKRKAAAKKAGNAGFIQKQIKGNHFYDDEEPSLIEAVADWLQQFKR